MITINLSMTEQEWNQLQAVAKLRDTPMSAILRHGLSLAIWDLGKEQQKDDKRN